MKFLGHEILFLWAALTGDLLIIFGDIYSRDQYTDDSFGRRAKSVASNSRAVAKLNDVIVGGSLKASGSVLSFGSFTHGGYGTTGRFENTSDHPPTPIRQRYLHQIVSNENAFAGIEQGGGIVCWGNGTTEGGCYAAPENPRPINIYSQPLIDEQLKKNRRQCKSS